MYLRDMLRKERLTVHCETLDCSGIHLLYIDKQEGAGLNLRAS